VAIEIALATVLLIAAGLLLRTFAFLAWIRNGEPIDHYGIFLSPMIACPANHSRL